MYKQIEFQGTTITAVPDEDGGFGYEIQIHDCWGGLHEWKESDDTYPTEDDALRAGKEFIDDYEPDDSMYTESLVANERMANFREEQAFNLRLK